MMLMEVAVTDMRVRVTKAEDPTLMCMTVGLVLVYSMGDLSVRSSNDQSVRSEPSLKQE